MADRKLGTERARDLGRKSARVRGRTPARILDELAGLTVLDYMDRLGFTDDSWAAWRAVKAAQYGLPLTDAQLATYGHLAGRTAPPGRPVAEFWGVAGRGSGKSRMGGLDAVYLGTRRYRFARGERGLIPCLAADREQATILYGYVVGMFEQDPDLARLIVAQRADELDLVNGVRIAVKSSHYRRVRGWSLPAALCDELAFWWDEESSNPDREILRALRPGLARVPGSMLVCLSSPYARRGELFRAYERYFGKDDPDALVVVAPTRELNPTIPEAVIARAEQEDPEAARSEWHAQFRSDIEALFAADAVSAVVIPGRREIPPIDGLSYHGFCDPSGGSADAFTLAISHREGDRAILDAIRERRPPFSPDQVCAEFGELLKSYRLSQVSGDRYAGQWPAERFQAHGITYRAAEKTKNVLYQELLPIVNGGRCELLDVARLRTQLEQLERKTGRSGQDTISHPPAGHDDVANSAAGALVSALSAPVTDWQALGEGIAAVNAELRKPGGSGFDPGRHDHEDTAWMARRRGRWDI